MRGEADIVVVGAGFSGAVSARVMAESGFRVKVLEKRSHVGGNAWDTLDAQGVRIHPYGPHVFHTNSPEVFEWLSRFTAWRAYEHRVRACVEGKYYPLPINRTTINNVFSLALDESQVASFLDTLREPRDPIRNSEDLVLSSVGKTLCELFFRRYTLKQWGLDLAQLSAGVAARLPVRTNDDDRYFTDKYQCMPADGYATLFERILDHPAIDVKLGAVYSGKIDAARHTIFTGPIDEYFGFRHGRLPYRSLRFEHFHRSGASSTIQPVAVINFPGDEPYTRITEFRHITGQVHSGSSFVREFPCSDGEPYYPVPTIESRRLFQHYKRDAERATNVTFIGRLAQYQYYNMDQVVAAALAKSRALVARLGASCKDPSCAL